MGFQSSSIASDRVGWDLVDRQFEMFRPEAQPRLPGELGVVADDVHLGVVEERVLVQVGGAEGEPVVVDDPDLCVDVDGIGEAARARVEGAGEEPAGVVVGFDQVAEDAARVVGAAARLRGEQQQKPEVRGRGIVILSWSRASISGDQRNWFSM